LALKQYLSSRWNVLEPVLSHGLDAAMLGIIVKGTSLALKSFLPPEYYEGIHEFELLFYIAMLGSLSVYTLVVFCFTLSIQILEAMRHGARRLTVEREPRELPSHNGINEIHSLRKKRGKVR
jgi:hypothetical protein